MLAMAQVQYIKHLRDREDKSIAEISQTVGIDWRTAKKYADRDDWSISQKRSKKRRPVMGPFEEMVDAWLLDNLRLPKKNRHTAKRIYDRLVAEHNFTGAERTVREYVAKRKPRLYAQEQERFVKLAHPEAEAQADFGTTVVMENGKLTERKYLVLSFPFSNAGFPYLVPSENAECLLQALKQLFEHIGGAPKKIWFDNLPAAVTKVLTGGERQLTEIFERFCLHYRFEPVFCNPGRGNEKGHVENKVGFVRRNWFVPIPQLKDLESFNTQLLKTAEEDLHRTHYEKDQEIADLWAQEREKLLVLPEAPFEVFRLLTATVDKYSRIRFEGQTHDVPRATPSQRVILKVYWDKIQVQDQDYETLATLTRHYSNKETPIDWVAHMELFQRKPRALEYSSFAAYLPPAVKKFLLEQEGAQRKQRIGLVCELLKGGYLLEQIGMAVAAAVKDGIAHDAGGVRHLLYRQTHQHRPEQMPESYTPACIVGYAPDMSVYDRLTRKGGGPDDLKLA